jgi:signal transduction histidine kinase
MNTQDHAAAGREKNALRSARGSGFRPRFLMPVGTTTAPTIRTLPTPARAQPPEAAAMIEVGKLLRSASAVRDVFVPLVELVRGVVPVDAVAIVAAAPDVEPLVWTSGAPWLEPVRVAAVAGVALDYFQTALAFDEVESAVASTCDPWLSLPITGDDGSILGIVALVPASAPDEGALAFIGCVARYLAQLFARADRLRHVVLAREHAEWLARTTDLRVVEAQRAREAAERSSQALRVASDATAVLLSTFDYRAALRHVARLVADELACGCTIDLEESGFQRIAQAPFHSEEGVAVALAPVVSDVMQYRDAIASTKLAPGTLEVGPRGRAVAARARRALDVDWIVAVPMSADGSAPLGVLTVFGTTARHAPIAVSIVEELARRAAIAIENGRLYAAATNAVYQREQVLAMVSHDLKNSFGVILMSVARMLEGMPNVERRQRGRSQLELIQRSARRMMKLVADLLDAAAIDAGQVSVTPRPCSVRSLVGETIEEMGPVAKAAGVELTCEVPSSLPAAQADAHRVSQILANLIGNAIKFTPEGGIVKARAEVIDSTEIAVSIVDNGIGIPPDHLAHIFDRFWQGPSGERNGTGLGLSICRGLVERSGGRIWAESDVDAGTTVTFTLPIAPLRATSS